MQVLSYLFGVDVQFVVYAGLDFGAGDCFGRHISDLV